MLEIQDFLRDRIIVLTGLQGGSVECIDKSAGDRLGILITPASISAPCAVLAMAFDAETNFLFISTVSDANKGAIARVNIAEPGAGWTAPMMLPYQEVGLCLAVLPKQDAIAVGTCDGELHIIDQALEKVMHTLIYRSDVYDAIFCSDQLGQDRGIIMGTNSGLILRYDGCCQKAAIAHKGVVPLLGEYAIYCICSDSTGQKVVAGTGNSLILILDASKDAWQGEEDGEWAVTQIINLPIGPYDMSSVESTPPFLVREKLADEKRFTAVNVVTIRDNGRTLFVGCRAPEPCYCIMLENSTAEIVDRNNGSPTEQGTLARKVYRRAQQIPSPGLSQTIVTQSSTVGVIGMGTGAGVVILEESGMITHVQAHKSGPEEQTPRTMRNDFRALPAQRQTNVRSDRKGKTGRRRCSFPQHSNINCSISMCPRHQPVQTFGHCRLLRSQYLKMKMMEVDDKEIWALEDGTWRQNDSELE